MGYLIGIVVFLMIIAGGRLAGVEDRRWYYPLAMVVIGLLYVLFAFIDGRSEVILREGIVAAGFILISVAAYAWIPIIVAFALIAHGVFDWIHPLLISNSGVPAHYPEFCLAVDVPLGMYLIVRKYGLYSVKNLPGTE